MRNALLLVIVLFGAMIFGVALVSGERPALFPSSEIISRLITVRDPQSFLNNVAEWMGAGEVDGADLRAAWESLAEASRGAGPADLVSIEAIRGTILSRYGHAAHAIPLLARSLRDSQDPDERESILYQLFRACWRAREPEAFRRAVDLPDLRAAFAEKIASDQKILDARQGGLNPKLQVKMLLAWFVLLLLPWFFNEIRCHRWRKQFPDPRQRRGPFFAFIRSPVGGVLAFLSCLLAMGLRLPLAVGLAPGLGIAVAHLLVTLLGCMYPVFRLDREVRQTTWSFPAYYLALIRLSLVNSMVLLIPILAILILREMTAALPLWPVLWPIGVGLGFPALCGALLLLLPLVIPLLLGVRRFPRDRHPAWAQEVRVPLYLWNLSGGKIYNALSFGYLTPTQGIAVTSPLAEEFPETAVAAIMAHERGHLEQGHLFVYFLLLFAGTMLGGLYAVTWPLEVQRCLMVGPTPWQILGFFGVFLVVMKFFRMLAWEYECQADAFAASQVGREEYIRALSDLTAANFLPERVREGEEPLGIHPPLQERKRRLRIHDGEYLEPGRPPSIPTLIALWRSRLALDWKTGQAEAVQLCALDYHLDSTERTARWRELALHHVEFGAEVLLQPEGRGLEVLSCAQKACARKADPPLPADRVCLLCSAGMKEALGGSQPLTWAGTTVGCRLVGNFQGPGQEA